MTFQDLPQDTKKDDKKAADMKNAPHTGEKAMKEMPKK
jgi:hypothetical protein